MPEFNAMDWSDGGARLTVETAGNIRAPESAEPTIGAGFDVRVSPYSKGYSGGAELAEVSTVDALEKGGFRDKIVLLHGKIAAEQLMPKNFVFYTTRRSIGALWQLWRPAVRQPWSAQRAAIRSWQRGVPVPAHRGWRF